MSHPNIQNYADFVAALHQCGFSLGGGNAEGIYSVIPWNWNEPMPYETPVRWHGDNPDLDPWEWRIRVLEERNDIAYAKLFFKKSGYITRQWYPYFFKARRGNQSFDEAYESGIISQTAKIIYDLLETHEALATHDIKKLAGFTSESKSAFDKALTELQMKMYITTCGQKGRSSNPSANQMKSNVFCLVDTFFEEQAVYDQARDLCSEQAYRAIEAQVLKLNPQATEKKIKQFILGS